MKQHLVYKTLARLGLSAAVLMSGGLADGWAQTQSAAAFYQGKTVRVLAAFGAAGNAGLLVQVIAAHLGEHLPGHPTVIPQFMPGGGGIVQANDIYNAAPKDGTVIGILFDNLPTTQVLNPQGIKFDARRFAIIGALNDGENGALAVRSDSPAKTIAEVKKTEIPIAATGPGTTAYSISNALNKLVGTKFRLVMGYDSGDTMLHAFDQREVEALLLDYNSLVRDGAALIKSGEMTWMLQIGAKPDSGIPNVPMLQSVAENTEQRQVFDLLSESRKMGKAVIAPPETPADRVQALRDAFQSLAHDQAFIDDAAKIGTKVEPRSWRSVADVIRETVDADPKIVKTAGALAYPQ